MRVPVPVVLVCCLAVIASAWWFGTREIDFMSPPTDATLQAIRQKAAAEYPRKESPPEPLLVKLPPAPILTPAPPPAKAPVTMGDLSAAPQLNQYSERRELGADHFRELATLLESNNQPKFALLAWERLLDKAEASQEVRNDAVSAIRRLHPEHGAWELQQENIPTLIIQFGTGKKTAKRLRPLLKKIEEELHDATSGLVRFSCQINTGRNETAGVGAIPIAIWITGNQETSSSTEVMSFTSENPDDSAQQIFTAVFQLMRSQLARSTEYQVPTALAADENPLEALEFRITRLAWRDIGNSLNQLQKSDESATDPR
ncbi:MAG: hypothetical protein EAZ42_10110 [Verrucomicrobia bacterium]|nr:MAG: hypothetical protein EAZ42_10110 [Verrucomicrobiota bacterium]